MTDREDLIKRVLADGLAQVRIAWADLHGTYRGKTVVCREDGAPFRRALDAGIGMTSTVFLKDTADHLALKVFDGDMPDGLPGFGAANSLVLRPDPASFTVLPWAEDTGWLRAEPFFDDGTPVTVDPRRVLEQAIAALADAGYRLRCGLEVEFHIYRIGDAALNPETAAWPGQAPAVELVHPGYNLLADAWADRAEAPLAIVRRTALALNMPLSSLEIELGPSQFEAVFDVDDALVSADRMVMFRNAVRQALAREGWYASFCCKPPWPEHQASGWHLHQSLLDAQGNNVFRAPEGLSAIGLNWLAGLLAHAHGMAALAAPTVPAYARFRNSPMAPQAAVWGLDNRGAMLRVLGRNSDVATRIENRIGEPMANPYLYLASQIFSGLDGLAQGLDPGPPVELPYAPDHPFLPATLPEALDALAADTVLQRALGAPMAALFDAVKRQEWSRWQAAEDKPAWECCEYFARY